MPKPKTKPRKRQPGGGRKPLPEGEKSIFTGLWLYPDEVKRLAAYGDNCPSAIRAILATHGILDPKRGKRS